MPLDPEAYRQALYPPGLQINVEQTGQLGKLCYEVFFTKRADPARWEGLPREEQRAWEAAAQAVAERILAELRVAEEASE